MSLAAHTQPGGAWRARPVAYALTLTLAGSLVAVVSLAGLSWYTVSGPNVVTDLSQAGSVNGAIVVVSPDIGSQHSWLAWLLFVVCVIAARLADSPVAGKQLLVMRVIAPILAGLLILGAIVRVVIPRLILGRVDVGLPAGTHVVIGAGFWLALLGFAMIGVGAALGPGRSSDHPAASAVPNPA